MSMKKTMIWAQVMLRFPNLAFAAIDTTSLDDDADIVRLTLVDKQGTVLIDRFIQPQRQPGQANTAYTGITNEQLLAAPSLAEVWDEIQAAFQGRYILAYGFSFLVQHLRENANASDLAPITLIGACLMDRAQSYYQSLVSLRLAELCRRIEHPLPQPATALDRLAAQRALLIAMSQGVSEAPEPRQTADAPKSDEDDDHPF